MGKTRPARRRRVTAPRRARGAWMWVVAGALVGMFALTISTMRRDPNPTPAAMPAEPAFLPTVENTARPSAPAPPDMVWVPGGEFSMGAADPADKNDAVGMQATADSRP